MSHRRPLTFATWKRVMAQTLDLSNEDKRHDAAIGILKNAAVSFNAGELTRRGFRAAERWAYNVSWSGSVCEIYRLKRSQRYPLDS